MKLKASSFRASRRSQVPDFVASGELEPECARIFKELTLFKHHEQAVALASTGSSFFEKNGTTFTNGEWRISRVRKALPSLAGKEDWEETAGHWPRRGATRCTTATPRSSLLLAQKQPTWQ